MGRRTKLTPGTEAAILAALRDGATRSAAAESAGIPRETMSRWLGRFVTFRHAVLRAEAEAEIRATKTVRKAMRGGGWRAAAWWLEHRRHDEWGRVDRVEIEVRKAAERIAERTGADPDWLVKRAVEIAAGAGRDD